MALVPVNINSIGGMLPVVDRKKIEDIVVVDGANFFVDGDGPVSGFGHSLICHHRIFESGNVETFDIQDRDETFIFTDRAVYVFDTASTRLLPMCILPTPVTWEFPWSHAFVGSLHFFARPGLGGLLVYDALLNAWEIFVDPAWGTGTVFAVTESGGRLIVLTEQAVLWSAIDDGKDLTTSTATGAGAQILSIIGSTDITSPLGVRSVPRGFITYTKHGMMLSELVDSINPFRHEVKTRKHIPINPFCIADTEYEERANVIMTLTGFFSTTGDMPAPWQPAMGEYFHRKVLPSFDVRSNQNSFRLHVDADRSWFIVSVAQSQADYAYSHAWVLYTPLGDKGWGKFNIPHRTFAQIRFTTGPFVGFNFCFIDYEGSIWRFDENNGIQRFTGDDSVWYYEYAIEAEIEGRYLNNVLQMASKIYMHTTNEAGMVDNGVYDLRAEVQESRAGTVTTTVESPTEVVGVFRFPTLLNFDPGVREIHAAIAPLDYDPLDAFVDVGLFRIGDPESSDRLSYTPVIAVGMLEVAAGSEEIDWMDEDQFPTADAEDWLVNSGEDEDWGTGLAATTDYDFETISTYDGYNQIKNSDSVPEQIRQEGRVRYYSCNNMGVYHILRFKAMEVGQNFHLHTLSFDLHAAGRLV